MDPAGCQGLCFLHWELVQLLCRMARTEARLDNCSHEPLWVKGLVHSSSKARRHQKSPGQLDSDTTLLARPDPEHRLWPKRAILVDQRRISSQGFGPPCPSRRPCDVGGSFVTCHQFSLLEGALRGVPRHHQQR